MTLDGHFVLALDVGGTSVKSARISLAALHAIDLSDIKAPESSWPGARGQRRDDIDSQGSADAIFDRLADLCQEHLSAAISSIGGIVLAFPGPCDYRRGFVQLRDLEKFGALYGFNLVKQLRSRLKTDLPIMMCNDAQAAAIGEAVIRRLQGRALMITLGTGFGSAFLDGIDIDPRTFPWSPTGELFAEPAFGRRADDVFSIRGLDARLSKLSLSCHHLRNLKECGRSMPTSAKRILDQFGADLGEWLDPYLNQAGVGHVIIGGGLSNFHADFSQGLTRFSAIRWDRSMLGDAAALVGGSTVLERKLMSAARFDT